MKLLTFEHPGAVGPGTARLGALGPDGGVIAFHVRDDQPALQSMRALIAAGAGGLARAREIVAGAQDSIDPATIRWLAPLPRPTQMRDFVAFEKHMLAAGTNGARLRETLGGPPAPAQGVPVPPIWYQIPIYYKCNRLSVVGPDSVVEWPEDSSVIDYELELACVIGTPARDVPADSAGAHIFGYTIFNDLTARDLQFREMQGPFGPAKGKDFDGGNVLGPVIVTTDEFDGQPALAMRAHVNGELWSDGNSATMHWSFAQMIAHVSRAETLHAGEILGSGTVGGGCGLELGRFLQHEDEVVLEIEGLGRLATRIHAPHVAQRKTL